MSSSDSPSSATSVFKSARISSWVVTSSAVPGSSAISSRGLLRSAMPISTRWRMPPESIIG